MGRREGRGEESGREERVTRGRKQNGHKRELSVDARARNSHQWHIAHLDSATGEVGATRLRSCIEILETPEIDREAVSLHTSHSSIRPKEILLDC